MRRREFLKLVSGTAVAWPLSVRAQQKIPRIGFMGNSTAALEVNLVNSFREGLRELGYEEGRNIVIDYLWAEGKYERFPALVNEFIASKVDVIVTAGTPAALAVKEKTNKTPLVMVAVGDPVGTGLVKNLARPEGNLTGLSSVAPDLEGKRLQLLREVVPALSRVAMLFNSLSILFTLHRCGKPARQHKLSALSCNLWTCAHLRALMAPSLQFARRSPRHSSFWRTGSSCIIASA